MIYYGMLGLILPFLGWAELVWKGDLPPSFEMMIQLNKETLALDEELQVQATFRYPSSYQLDERALIDQLIWSGNPFAPQVALGDFQVHPSSEKEIQNVFLQATLYPMKEGELKLSFLTLAFEPKKAGEKVINIQTPIFSLKILPASLDPSSLQLAPPVPLEPQFSLGLTEKNDRLFIENRALVEEEMARNRALWQRKRLPWLILLLLAFLGGMAGVIYWQRKRLFPPKPPVPWDPKRQAEIALKTVENKGDDSLVVKNYYHELGAILYRLLQESEGLSVKAMTTAELSQSLGGLSLPSEMKEEILAFLLEVDRIKFSAEQASARYIHADYERLLKFIGQL